MTRTDWLIVAFLPVSVGGLGLIGIVALAAHWLIGGAP